MKKFWMKAQEIDQDVRDEFIVAVCDEELLGKKINDFIKISEHFYKGELVEAHEVAKMLRKATTANIFGNKAVKAAVECGLVDEEDVKEIAGVKYVLIFTMG